MTVLEIVRFRALPDLTVEDVTAIHARFNAEEVPRILGLLRREAAVDDDGNWAVAVRFDTMEHATAGPRPDPGPAAKDLMGAIDRSTLSIDRFTIATE